MAFHKVVRTIGGTAGGSILLTEVSVRGDVIEKKYNSERAPTVVTSTASFPGAKTSFKSTNTDNF